MLYDVRLALNYDYLSRVSGGRHHVRVQPASIPGVQRVIAASLTLSPKPQREGAFLDFFGNSVKTIAFSGLQTQLDIHLSARVSVEDRPQSIDLSPPVASLAAEIAGIHSLDAEAPHHFLGDSPRVALDPAITDYASASAARTATVLGAVKDFGRSIARDFVYEPEVTDVETTALQAFGLRRGVCQDFAHVMIAGLRGLGIPAGYVSGFLRTIPPPGKQRLEGADAMHAWVRAWCGRETGWVDFDPTNAMLAGSSHITIGHGRDYADISPIVGVLKTSGGHKHKQSVDVVIVE